MLIERHVLSFVNGLPVGIRSGSCSELPGRFKWIKRENHHSRLLETHSFPVLSGPLAHVKNNASIKMPRFRT